MSAVWLRLAVVLYAFGLLQAFLTILRRGESLFPVAFQLFQMGVVLHGVSIVEHSVAIKHLAANNFFETASLCAFLMAVAYLFVEWRYKFSGLSVFAFPLICLLSLAGAMGTPVSAWTDPRVRNVWLLAHILLVLVGYSCLVVSAGAAVFYLLQERRLKRRKSGGGLLSPMTRGYAYLLYEHGVFGRPSEMYFGNLGLKGTTTWDVKNHQVPMVLCGSERPTVVTITTGGNDTGSLTNRAQRIADAVNMLLYNDVMADPIMYPGTTTPCPAVPDVTILVSNYPRMPGLEAALLLFSQRLQTALAGITVPEGSSVVFVDLYTPSLDRNGLVLGERGPDPDAEDINIHPTNLGHTFIAQQFEAAWMALQQQ